MAQLIEFVGTGGTMEGNFNDVPINVNTDAVHDFDGDNDYVEVGDDSSLDITGTLTISCWVKRGELGVKHRLIAKTIDSAPYDGFQLAIGTDNKVDFNATINSAWDHQESASTIDADSWHHIAGVYDGSDMYIYIDGVEDATSSATGSIATNNNALRIGRGAGTATDYLDGQIADVRVYDTGLSAANIQVLASKINVDTALGAGTGDLQMHIPIAGTTIDLNDSENSNDGTASGSPATVYDAFSVNVQDNTTTTDGAVTVTQGKLEGLSLSSVDMDGSADYIDCGNGSSLQLSGAFTISGWFRMDDATRFRAVAKESSHSGYLLSTTAGDSYYIQYGADISNRRYFVATSTGTADEGKWVHLVGTYDGSTTLAIYRNGVSLAGETTTTGTPSFGNPAVNLRIGNSEGIGSYANGRFSDVRIYDYALSADQAASLYSGSYNVTPLHGWKLDEGHATAALNNAAGAFEDFGTGTDADGQGVSLVDASCVNGTLDLDSTLTIAANGTLSAPRGTVSVVPLKLTAPLPA